MKNLSKVLILLTLFTLVFSWTAFFEKLERLKAKEKELRENVDFKNLGLSYLKEISLKDLVHFDLPDIKSYIEKLKYIIPEDLDPAHHREIDEFWTGTFESLKLPKPTQLINCFRTISGSVFFRKIKALNTLLQRSKVNDNVKLHTDFIEFEGIMKALEQPYDCVARTNDFERMTDKLGIPNDLQALMKAKYLYFQAKVSSLADDIKPIVDEIENKNYQKVGKLFGDFFKRSLKDYKKTGKDVLAYQAFGNGISGFLDLPLPSENINCYSAKEAKFLMDFFRGLSRAVGEGSWFRADQSAADYWESEGKALLEKIPKKSFDCDFNSKDTKQLGEKVGMDLSSEGLRDKMWDYFTDHSFMFYSYLRTMHTAFGKNDYLLAGSSYAQLLKAVAKSN